MSQCSCGAECTPSSERVNTSSGVGPGTRMFAFPQQSKLLDIRMRELQRKFCALFANLMQVETHLVEITSI